TERFGRLLESDLRHREPRRSCRLEPGHVEFRFGKGGRPSANHGADLGDHWRPIENAFGREGASLPATDSKLETCRDPERCLSHRCGKRGGMPEAHADVSAGAIQKLNDGPFRHSCSYF